MDIYLLVLMSLYCIVAILFSPWIPDWWVIVLSDVGIAAALAGIVAVYTDASPRWMKAVRLFYVIPLVYPMYNHTQILVPKLNWWLFDHALIWLDHFLFGLHPTQALQGISIPALTEYLQFTYITFYLLPCIHVAVLYYQRRDDEVIEFGRMMVFAYFLSYLAYFAFPAVGPRFFLHDFSATDTELPGLFLTNTLRQFVNAGGGLESYSANPIWSVNRDCMPSGHTMMTLVNIILAWRYKTNVKWLITIIGVSLIFSTVYLRYHYVVDVIAGVVCAFAVLPLEPKVHAWMLRHKIIQY
ncbi:MAG: phosphatase PAP2 family protein [Candidatus Kapabacteria bacterium]|nr:phosphatase PAP2 family protein [Candidatus Kapabacteria bacterium]